MKDYLSIKEFSDLTGIESSTLRYWDDIELFSPAKRDSATSYRYYTPDQIISVNFVTVLSELNVPLRTIREMTSDRTPETIVNLLDNQEKLLDDEIHNLYERYAVIHTRRELIKTGLKLAKLDDVSIVNLDPMHFVQGNPADFQQAHSFHRPFLQFLKDAKDLRVNLRLPIGALHEDWHSFYVAPGQPHYYFSVDPQGNRSRPPGRYVVGHTTGYYGEFGDLSDRMARFIANNGLRVVGPAYTIYLHDEICLKNPDQYLVYACIRLDEGCMPSREPLR